MQDAKAVVVAVDDGPRACCAPLLSVSGFVSLETGSLPPQARALFCGTSDSAKAREIEAAARRAARAARIPVVALEDYPGNYSDVEGGEADLLIVESELAAESDHARLAARCPATWVCPARYDDYRRSAARLRASYAQRDRAARLVLWAGQPETAEALATLRRIAPALAPLGATLLFRAHPRDPGYRNGAYGEFFSRAGIAVRDLTVHSLSECFALAPELVLTQFSSVAAEAGFHGISAVHFLYPDAGRKTLRAKKGYDVPPCCRAGASFLVRDPGSEAATLAQAIGDAEARARTMEAFDRYYSTSRETLGGLLAYLYNQGIISS